MKFQNKTYTNLFSFSFSYSSDGFVLFCIYLVCHSIPLTIYPGIEQKIITILWKGNCKKKCIFKRLSTEDNKGKKGKCKCLFPLQFSGFDSISHCLYIVIICKRKLSQVNSEDMTKSKCCLLLFLISLFFSHFSSPLFDIGSNPCVRCIFFVFIEKFTTFSFLH